MSWCDLWLVLYKVSEFKQIKSGNSTKTAYSVRHSTLFSNYAQLDLPDFICDWVEAFFHNRSHCTKIDKQVSDLLPITASIVQGSVLGPPSFLVTASDLQPLCSSNVIVKYADDTYVIIPASNHSSCYSEIQHVKGWAGKHNLKLNYKKILHNAFR